MSRREIVLIIVGALLALLAIYLATHMTLATDYSQPFPPPMPTGGY